MDQYIMELASYESTQGMLIYPTDFESILKLQEKTRSNFHQFKKMIQNNECSIEELEQMVINRHGPIPNANSKMTFQETIEHYANKPDALPPRVENDYLLMTDVLFKAFNNALVAEYNDLENESLNTPKEEIIEEPVKKAAAKKPPTKKKTVKKTDKEVE